MVLRAKRAAFFDAGFTLLAPTKPVLDVYLDEARVLDVEPNRDEFQKTLHRLWPTLTRNYRSKYPDLISSEELECEAWHDFTFELAKPFPELVAVHPDWFQRVAGHFDQPAAWRPMEGAETVLQELRRRGMTIGVVSNWHSALQGILEGCQLRSLVDFVLTSAEVGHKKPHRRIFEIALEHANAEPADAIHIGDSWDDDVEGALAMGITPVHLNPKSPASTAAADVHTIDRLSALIHGD